MSISNASMTLAERVQLAINFRQCSQSALANAAGVKPASVAQWLNGSTKALKAGAALRAADFLGVPLLWLTEGRGAMSPGSTQQSSGKVQLSDAESLFVQSVSAALETHSLPHHAMQTILMIIESAPKK